MPEKLQVFVSSVIKGLEEDRQTVADAIASVALEPEVFELLPAYSEPARDISLEKAAKCDLFIQIVGETVTPIVAEEYERASDANREKVLVFVKVGSHDLAARDHMSRVGGHHKYRSYHEAEELYDAVRDSVVAWMTRRLRTTPPPHPKSELISSDELTLNTGATGWMRFEVDEGDRVRGTVTSGNPYHTFDAWVLNEKQWAEWRNKPSSRKPDKHEVIAFAVDKTARRRETWYVAVKCLAWLAPIVVSYRLIRER